MCVCISVLQNPSPPLCPLDHAGGFSKGYISSYSLEWSLHILKHSNLLSDRFSTFPEMFCTKFQEHLFQTQAFLQHPAVPGSESQMKAIGFRFSAFLKKTTASSNLHIYWQDQKQGTKDKTLWHLNRFVSV